VEARRRLDIRSDAGCASSSGAASRSRLMVHPV
jgi:hypothetical protein